MTMLFIFIFYKHFDQKYIGSISYHIYSLLNQILSSWYFMDVNFQRLQLFFLQKQKIT